MHLALLILNFVVMLLMFLVAAHLLLLFKSHFIFFRALALPILPRPALNAHAIKVTKKKTAILAYYLNRPILAKK